jgi:hypothetical protein
MGQLRQQGRFQVTAQSTAYMVRVCVLECHKADVIEKGIVLRVVASGLVVQLKGLSQAALLKRSVASLAQFQRL